MSTQKNSAESETGCIPSCCSKNRTARGGKRRTKRRVRYLALLCRQAGWLLQHQALSDFTVKSKQMMHCKSLLSVVRSMSMSQRDVFEGPASLCMLRRFGRQHGSMSPTLIVEGLHSHTYMAHFLQRACCGGAYGEDSGVEPDSSPQRNLRALHSQPHSHGSKS